MIDNGAGGRPAGMVLETCVAGRHDRCSAWRDCGCGCHEEQREAVEAAELCAEGCADRCDRPGCGCACHEIAEELASRMWLFRWTGFVLWAVCGLLAGWLLAKLPGATWSLESFATLAQGAGLCLLAGWAGWLIASVDPGDEQTWERCWPAIFLVAWPVMVLVWLARKVVAGAGRLCRRREEVRTDGV